MRRGTKGKEPTDRPFQERLDEALAQQAATAEILELISRSPTDLQRVLEAILACATRLCEAHLGVLQLREGDSYRAVAEQGATAEFKAWLFEGPRRLDPATGVGRALLEGQAVHIADITDDPAYRDRHPARVATVELGGARTFLAVPMLRAGKGIGALVIYRPQVRPFTDRQIALVQTFANQAVIAVENARLLAELQEKNRALTTAHGEVTETLEQQTAIAEILRVISTSPTQLQPVLDAVVKSAARFCGAPDASIFRLDGENLRADAHHGPVVQPRGFLVPVVRGTVAGRSVLERRAVSVTDLQAETEEFPEGSILAAQTGQRATLSAPLLREGVPMGVILLRRAEAVAFTGKQIALLQTFADQAVIAIENVRLFNELQQKNSTLTETLEQQTATTEVLGIIASSPADVQPVFQAILAAALRLCGATYGLVNRYEAGQLHLTAVHNVPDEHLAELRTWFPLAVDSDVAAARAVRDRTVVQIEDVLHLPTHPVREAYRSTFGYRAWLSVPMLRGDVPIGVISIWRADPGPFHASQVELLKMFADQAVIAIENARLFTELQETNHALIAAHGQVTAALEQQTATSEILRVIARSPTDVQPVFTAIATSAARLCEAFDAIVLRVDGDVLRLVAHHGSMPAGDVPLHPGTLGGRTVMERRLFHIEDLQAEGAAFPEGSTIARERGHRTTLSVPLLRDGVAIGNIQLRRNEVRPFSDRQIALLQTFADQAVIAIENVRLFKELEEKNESLTRAHARVTEALEQQTATAEILRVISSSPMDVQPTFEAIAAAATRLCAAENAGVFLFDGELIRFAAHHGWTVEDLEAIRQLFPRPLGRGGVTGRAILDRAVAHVPDIANDPEYTDAPIVKAGFRAILSVPMLRDGQPIGTINVTRRTPVAFTDAQIALLRTFADQAVIAIENVRLFKELQARTRELTHSVEQLTALGDVSQKLSSTLDLDAVLQTIVTRASQLAGADTCSLFEYDEATETFHLRTTQNLDEEIVAVARRSPIRKGEGVQGHMAITRQPVQIPDIAQADAYRGPLRDVLLRAGTRAVLAVPLLREDQLIGGLTVNKRAPGPFPPDVIELLRTFATQSALAIQNARLFREIADKSRQLEAASRHKSEFLANMSHELRTPLNAIIGFSEVLTERMFGELNDKQEEYLKDIHASGQHLLSLINDILDLSKIEAGRMELEAKDFDLSQAIANAVTLVRERAARRGIALHPDVDPAVGTIRGDERKVKQVLLNLLSNALKFTPEGGRVDVRATVGDGVAEVSVTDTGVGIAPGDQEAVFEAFRQVGTADRKVEGTGLGLALSRKFVELHGGRIWVRSEVGRGSTFTFTLPPGLVPEPPASTS